MELFKKIRLRIGKDILLKKVIRIKRDVYSSNFSEINSIGIVWDASRPAELGILTGFYHRMMEMKIDVKIFGFYPGKILPDQYVAIRYFTCLKRDEVSFFYHPVSSEAAEFINIPFDILIDINFEKHFPLSYVTILSNARFKVGLFDQKSTDTPFDLMMEINKPVDIENYLVQIIHYLKMVKNETVNTIDANLN